MKKIYLISVNYYSCGIEVNEPIFVMENNAYDYVKLLNSKGDSEYYYVQEITDYHTFKKKRDIKIMKDYGHNLWLKLKGYLGPRFIL